MFAQLLEKVLTESIDTGIDIYSVNVDRNFAQYLHIDPGAYTFDPSSGAWDHDGVDIPQSVGEQLFSFLKPEQQNAIRSLLRRKQQKEGEDDSGTINDPALNDPNSQGLLPWEREYLTTLKEFMAKHEITGKALLARHAGLNVPEFPEDYLVLDPGGDYVVVTSQRTRMKARINSRGNGTYVFRKVAPDDININGVKIDKGEEYTSFVKKLRPDTKKYKDQLEPLTRLPKLILRDNAKSANLGFMLRRDMHYKNIAYILNSPGLDFDTIRKHCSEMVEQFLRRLDQLIS